MRMLKSCGVILLFGIVVSNIIRVNTHRKQIRDNVNKSSNNYLIKELNIREN